MRSRLEMTACVSVSWPLRRRAALVKTGGAEDVSVFQSRVAEDPVACVDDAIRRRGDAGFGEYDAEQLGGDSTVR